VEEVEQGVVDIVEERVANLREGRELWIETSSYQLYFAAISRSWSTHRVLSRVTKEGEGKERSD